MKSSILLLLLLVLTLPLSAQAAPQAAAARQQVDEVRTETAAVDSDDAIIPEREIEFEHSEEEHAMKLFRADPKLFEQKFVAVVRFESPSDHLGVLTSLVPADLQALLFYQGHYLFGRRGTGPRVSPIEYFRRLRDNLPDHEVPDRDAVSIFTEENVTTEYLQFGLSSQSGAVVSEFRILAPTAELAQQRAAALVQLFDYGLVQPIRTHLLSEKSRLEEQVPMHEKRIVESQQTLAELQEQLKTTEAISQDELSALKTQQRLLAVDLSGTQARIEAANKLLSNRAELSSTRIDQIENIKVTAEIELAGLSGRQQTLEEIINHSRKRLQLEDMGRTVQARIHMAQEEARNLTRSIGTHKQAIEVFRPLPLHEGKIVIQPIRWID